VASGAVAGTSSETGDHINLATAGGVQFPEQGRSIDHLTLANVDASGVSIASLSMEGTLDKTGRVPLAGDELVFEKPKAE